MCNYNAIREVSWDQANPPKQWQNTVRRIPGLLAMGLLATLACSTATGAEGKRPAASANGVTNASGTARAESSDAAKQGEPVERDEQDVRSGASTSSLRSARRLPRYFGKLDLVDDQREQIFRVQQHYQQEIERREIELAELRLKREEEVRQVLSEQQRARLAEFEAESRANSRPNRDTVEKSAGESVEAPAVVASSPEN